MISQRLQRGGSMPMRANGCTQNGLRASLVSLAALTIIPSLAPAAQATPSEAALESCQQRIATELPGTAIELIPGLELFDLTLIRWQTDRGSGFCRVTSTGEIVEFINPFALPRGQRPIESLIIFETDEYTVRVLRLVEQLYLTVYDRAASEVELDRALAQVTESDEQTIYTNLLGQTRYQAIVSSEGEYRLVIRSRGVTTYEALGEAIAVTEPRL
ncbi:hypothetical protein [Egbenema bharatensis]|uniref:hypothetical protein n=1 Tax=Egbenema bharatensis TaxID=3463334 RepID=UPI003A838CE2